MAGIALQLNRVEARLAGLDQRQAPTIPDPVAIFEAGGTPAEPWQLGVLRSQSRRLALLCCRQAGKSTLSAALAIHSALSEPGSLALLISATQAQSAELLRRCIDAYHSVGGIVPAEAQTLLRLELANHSRVVALPGANDASIRGYTARTVIMDEAARIHDPLFYATLPMVATTDGRLLLLSSAYAKAGFFYKVWTEGGADWERHKLIGPECPHIAPEVLEEARQTMPDPWFRREWLCEFTDSDDAWFGYDEVMAAISDDVPPLLLGGA